MYKYRRDDLKIENKIEVVDFKALYIYNIN